MAWRPGFSGLVRKEVQMTTIIDLSLPITMKANLVRMPEVEYIDHDQSAKSFGAAYGMEAGDFREGKYAAVERITIGTHDTTHLDSPWHFYPTSEGKPSKTIDQIPLEWCYSDGVVLDFHHKKKGERIGPDEVRDSLKSIGYELKPFDIVLIRTDMYKHHLEPGYENMHPGMAADATLWLIDQGIKVVGIDAWGWDRAHEVMAEELKAGNKDQFWESHYLGKDREYCHLERLANLDKIPRPFGFKVAVFPIKIEGASAGWVRAVAIIEG
jgi:kynurenine formamidase